MNSGIPYFLDNKIKITSIQCVGSVTCTKTLARKKIINVTVSIMQKCLNNQKCKFGEIILFRVYQFREFLRVKLSQFSKQF